MKLAVGADHAGYDAKEHLKRWLVEQGHDVDDIGTHGTASVDYPDFAGRVARAVAGGKVDFGLLVCGSGTGMAIAANKVRGVRAAACTDAYTARLSRLHNDANVLCLGARVLGLGAMEDVLTTFLTSGFDGGRHARRVDKIHRLEESGVDPSRSGC